VVRLFIKADVFDTVTGVAVAFYRLEFADGVSACWLDVLVTPFFTSGLSSCFRFLPFYIPALFPRSFTLFFFLFSFDLIPFSSFT
jgi:hypothetical protein